MTGKRSRVITGWRQVKPEPGSSGRRFFPGTAPKGAPRVVTPEAASKDRWESEGGSVVPPAIVAPAVIAAKPKIRQ